MSYRLIIQDRAIEELRANARYLAEHYSPEAGYEWVRAFLKALESLKKNPRLWGYSTDTTRTDVEIRQLLFRRHKSTYVANYSVEEETVRVVRVLSIRHSAQDHVDDKDSSNS